MIAPVLKTTADFKDRLRDFAWKVFLEPAERGLLLGLETAKQADETSGDAIVDRVRWLLPESERGLQVARAYVAPGFGGIEMRDYFSKAIATKLPRPLERLLLVVDGFDLLEPNDRVAHLATLRFALRMPNVVVALASRGFQLNECRFFDRIV
ncbi:MAG: hypothetical protein ACRENA_07730 [Vulcanimicrobiaceae bacterium]